MKPKYKIGQFVIYHSWHNTDYGRISKIIIDSTFIKYEIDNAPKDRLFEESELTTNPCDWIDSLIHSAEEQINIIRESTTKKINEIKRVFKLK